MSLICINVSFGILKVLKIRYTSLTGKNIGEKIATKSKCRRCSD